MKTLNMKELVGLLKYNPENKNDALLFMYEKLKTTNLSFDNIFRDFWKTYKPK